jgi:hypothetical protein
LSEYVDRIEGFRNVDFTICIENAKSLLESIAKEICVQRSQEYSVDDTAGKILKLAFSSLGYDDTDTTRQIAGALANVGQQMGNLRNDIGATSHGRTLAELEARKDTINKVSAEFLLISTELVACFLIELFETEFPRKAEEQEPVGFDDNDDFNEYLDDMYGEFEIGRTSYAASEILFNLDPVVYESELQLFRTDEYENTD